MSTAHCVKSVGIRNYSGSHFPAFGPNTDQNNSEYGHFLCSGEFYYEGCVFSPLSKKVI